ncbi:hypothetical protein ARMSODRAFT_983991 [Armillaria solidipes]|uniref:Uncharacterized protein n=1 Tax=Armillaria solidipes TaxID=1076256 RepID=A0A2H3ATN2_9AGAR|nr:hypothetical protein ARMSODRAFT_983991 [Armillaria solidipes]
MYRRPNEIWEGKGAMTRFKSLTDFLSGSQRESQDDIMSLYVYLWLTTQRQHGLAFLEWTGNFSTHFLKSSRHGSPGKFGNSLVLLGQKRLILLFVFGSFWPKPARPPWLLGMSSDEQAYYADKVQKAKNLKEYVSYRYRRGNGSIKVYVGNYDPDGATASPFQGDNTNIAHRKSQFVARMPMVLKAEGDIREVIYAENYFRWFPDRDSSSFRSSTVICMNMDTFWVVRGVHGMDQYIYHTYPVTRWLRTLARRNLEQLQMQMGVRNSTKTKMKGWQNRPQEAPAKLCPERLPILGLKDAISDKLFDGPAGRPKNFPERDFGF